MDYPACVEEQADQADVMSRNEPTSCHLSKIKNLTTCQRISHSAIFVFCSRRLKSPHDSSCTIFFFFFLQLGDAYPFHPPKQHVSCMTKYSCLRSLNQKPAIFVTLGSTICVADAWALLCFSTACQNIRYFLRHFPLDRTRTRVELCLVFCKKKALFHQGYSRGLYYGHGCYSYGD